jgi:hypothetical protein
MLSPLMEGGWRIEEGGSRREDGGSTETACSIFDPPSSILDEILRPC